jgi:hypothetical protein
MPEATLQHVALDPGLWAILVPPLLGAVVSFVVALRDERARAGSVSLAKSRRRAAVVASLCTALSFALIASRAARIADMPEGARFLADHALRLARIGSLDANFDLAFDPITAVASSAIAFAGTVTLALGARIGSERSAQSTGASSLAVAALLLACLASDAVVMLAALDMCVLSLALATVRQSRIVRMALAGGAISLGGVATVFWGLGGGWAGGDYTVDFSPHVFAVRENGASDDDDDPRPAGSVAEGSLTMIGHPGAVVFLDDARTPLLDGDHALRSPFVGRPITAGRHVIRVHSGAGTDDFIIRDALAAAGEELTIAWGGPTLSFREMRDALGLRDERGSAAIREAFSAREFLPGVRPADAACLLLLFGVGATSVAIGAAARQRDASLLGDAALLALVWYAAARLDPLLALAPFGRSVLALVGSVLFVVAAARARRSGRVASAMTALVLLGAGVHAAPFGGIVAVVAILALASAELARDGAPRLVATSVLAGAPIPMLGASWGAIGILGAAWTTPPGGPVAGAALVALSLAGAFLLGASAPAITARGANEEGRGAPRTAFATALVAAALGPLLGASRGWIEERGEAAVSRALAPFVVGWTNGGRSHGVAIALAWTGATLGGWAYGRRRSIEAVDLEVGGRRGDDGDDPSGVSRAGLDLVLGVDRWVVGAMIGGVVNGARAAGWSIGRIGGALLEAPCDAAARVVGGAARRSVGVRTGMVVVAGATLVLAAWAAR